MSSSSTQSDLDDVFDGIIEATSFWHALEDCECRWNIADFNHDLVDQRLREAERETDRQ